MLEGSEEQMPLWNMFVDFEFFKTLDIQLVEGRSFDIEKDNDSIPTYIINEAAVNNFNIENAIGKRIGSYIDQNGTLPWNALPSYSGNCLFRKGCTSFPHR